MKKAHTQSKVTSKGQITIPLEVRRRLGLTAGSKIDFVWRADGGLGVEVVRTSVASLAGMLHQPDRAPVSLEQMEDAIRAGAARGTDTSGGLRS